MKRIIKHIKKFLSNITSNDGFSFIELMFVIAIIAVLGILIVPNFMGRFQKARYQTTVTQIKQLETLLQTYNLENGSYPSSDEGLNALAPYIQGNKTIKDGWGKEFIYNSPGTEDREYEIISLGADGQEGGDDYDADIKSWEI